MVVFNATMLSSPVAESPPRILIADGCPDVRGNIRRVLADVDCHIDEASNGLDALQLILAADFDLLITDLDMEPLSGLELIAALDKLPVDRQRPEVIVWSSLASMKEMHRHPALSKAALILTRSTTEDILLVAVQAVLDDPLQFVVR